MNNFEIQENFLNQLAKAYDTYDVSLIDEFIAKNFNFSHIWQVSEMKGRDVFLCYLSIRLEEAKENGLKGRFLMTYRRGDGRPMLLCRTDTSESGNYVFIATENNAGKIKKLDMYNLYPSVGAVNAVRSNYNFAELPEDVDFIIDACNFKVLGHKVEPADMYKGEIARTYLYFDSEYPTYSMSKQSRRMMDAWNVLYPVTPWECTRAKRIEEIQGNPNPFVKEPCIEQGLYK